LHRARVRVAAQASEPFCEHILKAVLVEAEIGHELLKLAAFLLRLPKTPQFARVQALGELLSAVKQLFEDAHPP
jgi:hypothetical protein